MKILEITFVPPDKKSGGGLGIYQSIKSLLGNGDVDYIGPEFESNLFASEQYKFNILSTLHLGKRSIMRLLFKGISTAFYDDWKLIEKKIKWHEYDIIHIESSRYYFVVKAANSHNAKCMVRMHNIESEYGLNIYKKNRRLSEYLRFRSYRANEKKTVGNVDALIFLTDKDIVSAKELYKVDSNICYKNPVCIDAYNTINRYNTFQQNRYPIKFLMTGTLNYGSNVDGIIWFIETVWNKYYNVDKLELTVAGAHPNDKLKKIIEQTENVNLVDTPIDMAEYFKNSDIYIASVFDGAGMKVKVAEALSYGLPVIGTSHAFIGYENVNQSKFLADTEGEFVMQINRFIAGKVSISSNDIFREFYEQFSMDHSVAFYKNLLEKIAGGKK